MKTMINIIYSIPNVYAVKSHSEGLTEVLHLAFSYEPHQFNDKIGLFNTKVKKDKLFLRSSVAASSLVRWENTNEIENWAFSATFELPQLNTREVAGFYIYYTKEKVTTGNFNGGMSKFDGFVFGFEMKGGATDLVFIKNKGDEDLSQMEDVLTKRDSLKPKRFRNIKNLTMKVIATERNVKIELYNGTELLYDYFRFNQSFGAHEAGKHFGIIADYKNTSSSKAFILKEVKFYKRDEAENYNMYHSQTPKIQDYIRGAAEIKHGDADVKELIHKMELVEFLVKRNIGNLPDTVFVLAKEEFNKDLKKLKEKMNQVHETKLSKSSAGINSKINDLSIKMMQLKRAIMEFEHHLGNVKEKQLENHTYLQYIALFVGIIGVVTFVIRELYAQNK